MKKSYEGILKMARLAVAGLFILIIAMPALTSASHYI